MAITLKQTDAVVVGMGWTGSILARELTKAGLNVVGLERRARISPFPRCATISNMPCAMS
jgi:gluconate 2-dehydrogenase alpha chain